MKITIERETLERAISDYDAAAGNDGALLTLVRTRTALFDLLRKALAQPADNEWRTAIEEELICAHIGTADSFPDAKSALKSLLDWHVAVSLDPQVSSAAQALIDRGQALAQPAEPVAIKDRAAAYETIDRYLRNNLDDSDYAGYSAALEEVWNGSQAAQPAPAAVPLTDEQIERLRENTFSTNNPYCPVDSKSMRKAVRAAERAHGIAGGAA